LQLSKHDENKKYFHPYKKYRKHINLGSAKEKKVLQLIVLRILLKWEWNTLYEFMRKKGKPLNRQLR